MSFSCEFKILRSGNSYDLRTQTKMSTHGDEHTGVAETGITEGSEEGHLRFSSELVDERIKASLEPLHAQIFVLTDMMERLFQSNLTTESTTASTRGLGLQNESPYGEEPGSSKFLTVAPLTTAGYSPRQRLLKIFLRSHAFLVVHHVGNVNFLLARLFSVMLALKAVDRKDRGVNGGPCRYKGVKGVLQKSYRALNRFHHCTRKIAAAYSPKNLIGVFCIFRCFIVEVTNGPICRRWTFKGFSWTANSSETSRNFAHQLA